MNNTLGNSSIDESIDVSPFGPLVMSPTTAMDGGFGG
jgi:hypothetical protein